VINQYIIYQFAQNKYIVNMSKHINKYTTSGAKEY